MINKEFNEKNYISLYNQSNSSNASFPRWQLCMMPHPSKTLYDNEKRSFVPVNVPTIIAENILTKKDYGYAYGVKFDILGKCNILVSEIVKVESYEKKSLLMPVNAIRVWLRGNSKMIPLIYSKKLFGAQAEEAFQYLQQVVVDNNERLANEELERKALKEKQEKEAEEKAQQRERKLNSMTPVQRQAFLAQERKEAEEEARQRAERENARKQRRLAEQEKRKEQDRDRQIKELTEQLKIANQRAAAGNSGKSGSKDVVKGAAVGWFVAGPVGGIIGAIAGKAKSDSKK